MKRPFLTLESSFLPLLAALSSFGLVLALVLWLKGLASVWFVVYAMRSLIAVILIWMDLLGRESKLGYHTAKIVLCLRVGMLLFIFREVMFFGGFFWAFFDARVSPTIYLGMSWPPLGIHPINPFSVPLLNTIILLRSGVTVTWAHHNLLNNEYLGTVQALSLTIILGLVFLVFQWFEYTESTFTITSRIYGRTFFVTTGFHGLHVAIGTSILRYSLWNVVTARVSYNHHVSFEVSAWYWHFVDVVWLGLYIWFYIWSTV